MKSPKPVEKADPDALEQTAYIRIQNYKEPPLIEGDVASQDGNREGSKTEGDTARGADKETVLETQRQSVEQVEEE